MWGLDSWTSTPSRNPKTFSSESEATTLQISTSLHGTRSFHNSHTKSGNAICLIITHDTCRLHTNFHKRKSNTMCRPTGGTISPMSNERISRNIALNNLLGSLEQANKAVSQAKQATMAVSKTAPKVLHSVPKGHQHQDGGSSTEEEHPMDDSSGGPPTARQAQSSIATRVRRKRHSREQSKPETMVVHQSTVQHHYHDFAASPPVNTSGDGSNQSKKSKGGIAFPFPSVLHAMLERADHEKFDDIVSWQPHGRAFAVHNPNRFVKEVMPQFFRQTRFASFQRQLSLYGFLRLTRKGPDHGAYYHELFVRGRSDLCQLMQRTRVKGSWVRQSSSPDTEPNFSTLPVVPKSTGKPLPELPPLRNTSSAKHTTINTVNMDPVVASSLPSGVVVATYRTAPPLASPSYPTSTGFGWTNSTLVSNPNGEITFLQQEPTSSRSKIPAASAHTRGGGAYEGSPLDNIPDISRSSSSSPYPRPPAQQQYFEPPQMDQVALAAFLFDVGLDSDEELRKELAQYDTEPLPWNSPSNQTEL